MPTIDDLDIQIQASAKNAVSALDNMISKLGSLNTALNKSRGIVDGQAYERQMKNVEKVASDVAKELISDFNVMGRDAQKQINSMVENWVKGMDKVRRTGKGSLGNALNMDALGNVIVNNMKSIQEVDKQLESFLNKVRNSKIFVSDFIVNDVDWTDLRKAMPQTFLRDKNKGGISVDSFYQQLNESYPNLFPEDLANASDRFEKIVEVIREAQENLANSTQTSTEHIDDAWTAFVEKIVEIEKEIPQRLEAMAEASKNVTGSLGENLNKSPLFNTESVERIGQNMVRMQQAFESLNGTQVQTQGISELANALNTLNKVDIGKISSNLEQLGKALPDNLPNLAAFSQGLMSLTTPLTAIANIRADRFSSIVSKLNKFSQIDSSGLNNAAFAISQIKSSLTGLENISDSANRLIELSTAISRLGYKSVSNAITNLPLLSTELRRLMIELSTAPVVSQNLIDMTNALANLGAQGANVGTATRSITNGLNGYTGSANRAHRSTLSLAAAFGRFYASFFLIIRGVKKLQNSITSSMDYIENLNYFDKAFEQVAKNADLSVWQNLGYESAEEYANSFAERAKALTSKMTGFNINDDGTLTASGQASLGIDPQKLMNYQAIYGQIASSMGTTSDQATKLSQVLSELGADLASVKNMNFEDVWQNLSSAMVGMSRVADKYGINLRNVNLQQKLTDLGIQTNITNLNQQDKVLLRTIVMLDSTRYAWADLAETLNQPANQLRLLTANLNNLSRVIGNLFLPVVSKTLPYLNGLTIATQRLFTWLGKIMGIDLSEITSSVGDSDTQVADLLADVEDTADGLGSATDEAKKLKKALQGFDELNVITTNTDDNSNRRSGDIASGILDDAFNEAYSNYQAVWDKAFENVENNAQKIADAIEKVFNPLKALITSFADGNFFEAGGNFERLATAIFNYFKNALAKVDWEGIGKNVGKFIEGIDWFNVFNSITGVVKTAFSGLLTSWGSSLASAPLETMVVSAMVLPGALRKLGGSSVLQNIGKLTSKIKGAGTETTSVVTATTNWKNKLSVLATKGFKAIGSGAVEFLLVSDAIRDITNKSDHMATSIAEAAAGAAIGALGMYAAFGPAGLAMAAVVGLTGAIVGIQKGLDDVNDAIIGSAIYGNGGKKISEFADEMGNIIEKSGTTSEKIEDFTSTLDNNRQIIQKANDTLDTYSGKLDGIGSITSDEMGEIQGAVDDLAKAAKDNLAENINIAITSLSNLEDTAMDFSLQSAIEQMQAFGDTYNSVFSGMQNELDSLAKKVMDGSATDKDYQKISQLVGDISALSLEAIQRKVEIENAINDLSNLDFEDEQSTTNAINHIRDIAKSKLSEVDTYYSEAINQANLYIMWTEEAYSRGKISADQRSTDIALWTNAKKSYQANWEQEKGNIQKQVKTAYDYIAKQAEAQGVKVFEQSNGNHGALNRFDKKKDALFAELTRANEEVSGEIVEFGSETYANWEEALLQVAMNSYQSFLNSGKNTVEAYEQGILDNKEKAKDAVNEMLGYASTAVENYYPTFEECGKTLAQALASSMQTELSEALKNGTITAEQKIVIQNGMEKSTPSLLGTVNFKFNSMFKQSGTFAAGGFPEDGLFFANHTELVGRFANGKTAVANNAEITAGIEEAAYRGYMRAMQESGAGNTNVSVTLEGDARGLFKAVKSEWKDEARRIQGNPVPIY